MRVRPALLVISLFVLLAAALPGQAVEPQRPSLSAISDLKGVVYSNVNRSPALLLPDLPRLRSIGVNHVTLYVYLFVDSPTSSSVKSGPTTPSDTELGLVIDEVHAAGMTVAVAPLPWWSGGPVWRGEFQPKDPDAFFDSWRFHIGRYAELAERHDAELFSIGSEQLSLQDRTDQWLRTAAVARERFSGPLTYLAVPGSVGIAKFWDALDVVSISPYIVVSQAAEPTYDEVRDAWLGYIPLLGQISRDTGRPVLIAETGFVNAQFFGKFPSQPSPSEVPAPQAQADAYAGVLDAIADTPAADRSFLLGINWWDWDPLSNSVADTTFSPRGKPAECVLARTWGSGVVKTLADVLPCGTR